MIFYTIYKNQPDALYYLSYNLQSTPETFTFLRRCPYFVADPWKEISPRNVTPRGGGRHGWSKFRQARRRLGQGRAGKGSMGYWGAIWGLGWGREKAGGGASRLPAAAAAGVAAPARRAAPAAHWDVEQFACEAREGTASSEDRRAGLGGSSAAGQGTAVVCPWWRGGVGSVPWRGGPVRRGEVTPPL
jgi:hypothetical protein